MKREKLYKIGEVMQYTSLSRQTLHNYTVAGLIHEARRTISGHRLYDESTFDRLEQIKILQAKKSKRSSNSRKAPNERFSGHPR
jgi:DNA-binding transcriptional MerR regulator